MLEMLCGTNQSALRARPGSDNLHKNARHGGRLYTRGWCSWDHMVVCPSRRKNDQALMSEPRSARWTLSLDTPLDFAQPFAQALHCRHDALDCLAAGRRRAVIEHHRQNQELVSEAHLHDLCLVSQVRRRHAPATGLRF